MRCSMIKSRYCHAMVRVLLLGNGQGSSFLGRIVPTLVIGTQRLLRSHPYSYFAPLAVPHGRAIAQDVLIAHFAANYACGFRQFGSILHSNSAAARSIGD